jgi:hypothetical protein
VIDRLIQVSLLSWSESSSLWKINEFLTCVIRGYGVSSFASSLFGLVKGSLSF